jgi:hypothetical protein
LPFLPLSQQKNGEICVQDLWPTNHWAEQWISSLLLGWATEGGFSTLVSAFVIHSPSWIFLNFLSRAPQQADPQTVSSQEVIQFRGRASSPLGRYPATHWIGPTILTQDDPTIIFLK